MFDDACVQLDRFHLILSIKQPVFVALRQGFRSSKSKRSPVRSRQRTILSSLSEVPPHGHTHTHALRRWFFCLKNSTCVRSKLAMLPSSALHLPCQGWKCQEHMGAATAGLDSPEIHQKCTCHVLDPSTDAESKIGPLMCYFILHYTPSCAFKIHQMSWRTQWGKSPLETRQSHEQLVPILRPFVWWNQMCLMWK